MITDIRQHRWTAHPSPHARDIRVLLVDNVVHPEYPGRSGHSDIIWDMARGFPGLGVKATVVGPYQPPLETENAARVPFVRSRMPIMGMRNAVGYCLVVLNIWRAISKKLSEFDLIHTTDAFSCGVMSTLMRDTPIVLTVSGSIFERIAAGMPPDWAARLAYIAVSRQAARRAAKIHATSDDMAHWWEVAGASPARVGRIPLGVNTQIFRPSGDPRAGGAPLRILFIGRFAPENDIEILIEALQILRRDGIELCASLVGDGVLMPKIKRMIGEFGLSEHVQFLGKVDMDDLPDLYRAADLLALPRCGSAPPRVMLQAMACGTPVVGMRVGSTLDYVQDGDTGLLARPRDIRDFATAMRRIGSDGSLRDRLGRAGVELVATALSWNVVLKRLRDEVYEPILRERAGRGV